MTALKAGATIGILGGGQLGRMLGSAAAALGFDVSIYCPEEDCPAARVAARHTIGAYTDRAANETTLCMVVSAVDRKRLILRAACRIRCSFSTSAMRT